MTEYERFLEKKAQLGSFDGVGSEPYGAVTLGRKAVAIELKPSYYRQMVKNMGTIEDRWTEQATLFEVTPCS